MRSEAEIRRAIARVLRSSQEFAGLDRDIARTANRVADCLLWAIGESSDLDVLLKGLYSVDEQAAAHEKASRN